MGTNTYTLRTYWQEIKKHKTSFFIAFFFIPTSMLLLTTLLPYMLSEAIGSLSEQDGEQLAHYLWLGGIIGAGGFVLNIVGYHALTWQESSIHKELSNSLLERILGKDMGFFINEKIGALTSRYINFIRSHVQLQDLLIMQTLGFILSFGVGLTILAVNSPLLGVIVGGLFFLIILMVRTSMKIRSPWRHKRKKMIGDIHGKVADTISNSMIVKTFGNEEMEQRDLARDTEEYRKLWIKDIGFAVTEGSLRHIVMVVTQLVAIGICGSLVLQDEMELGIAIFVLAYLQRLASELFQLGDMINGYDRALLEAAPLSDILMRPIHVTDHPEAIDLHNITPRIVLDHITYRYNDGDENVVNDVSLDIAPGEKIGLVGHSGAGKSTLTALLLRFADVTDGAIKIDDHDIRNVTQASLRHSIAYVPQEPMLFHRTLRENITYGRPDATDEEVRRAAQQANALEFIDKLPNGFDTLVGERGVKLSGGQRQRVAIARALLKDAPILVLDEATSALDSESEKLIQEALTTLMQGRTSIVIAHRLSTIARLDRIVVLENGTIAEQGTHQQLLAHGGVYASLWAHQSGGFIEE